MLSDIPQTKWDVGTGRQVILKNDFQNIEEAVLESLELKHPPLLTWVDATQVKVDATADSPARVMMKGFPNVLHPGTLMQAGLTDGKYRANTSAVSMDFDTSTTFWGTEKGSQWYALFALAGDSDTTFTLKAMPWMRVKSQAAGTPNVLSLGNISAPATGIGYGFTTDELIGAKMYFISGASKGIAQALSANNNDNSTGGTLSYTGTALTVSQGDWFIILPYNTNFRWLGDILNNASSNIKEFHHRLDGFYWDLDVISSVGLSTSAFNEMILHIPPMATVLEINRSYGGANVGGTPQIAALYTDLGAIILHEGDTFARIGACGQVPISLCRYASNRGDWTSYMDVYPSGWKY